MTRQFQRKIEDFTCEQCGAAVVGNGYTNHCPKCLYSKHVDVNPGDREADCGGLMPPIAVELKNSQQILVQQCLKCRFIRRNKVVPEDDFEAVLRIMRSRSGI